MRTIPRRHRADHICKEQCNYVQKYRNRNIVALKPVSKTKRRTVYVPTRVGHANAWALSLRIMYTLNTLKAERKRSGYN